MKAEEKVESYKSLSTFEQKNFISQLLDLLLYSPYFYIELKKFISDYKKEKNVQELRRTTIPVFAGDVRSLLPNYEKVQPKEDFTTTAEYKAARETKGILPFEDRLSQISPLVRSALNKLQSRSYRNTPQAR